MNYTQLTDAISDYTENEFTATQLSTSVKQAEPALQLIPGREYCVVMCEDETQWEEMKQALGLSLVRRGGYKQGSAFDAVNTQRVIQWKDLAGKVAR